jgi:hypothetical protein
MAFELCSGKVEIDVLNVIMTTKSGKRFRLWPSLENPDAIYVMEADHVGIDGYIMSDDNHNIIYKASRA